MVRGECQCPVKSWHDYFSCEHCNFLYLCCNSGETSKDRARFRKRPCHCMLQIWTDGCCLNNGQDNARGGIGVWFNFDNQYNYSGRLDRPGPHTNQRAEILAVITALNIARDIIERDDIADFSNGIKIHTDSRFVIDAMTEYVFRWRKNNWRKADRTPVANRDLLEELDETIDSFTNDDVTVLLQHVPRALNQEADELARQDHDLKIVIKLMLSNSKNK